MSKNRLSLRQQYEEAKARHPDTLLLFRIRDFYQCFAEDAETAAKALGLTLSHKGQMLLAGFPHHQLEYYLRKLLQAGHKVAICEQPEE
jgi:DNA mismatch repair protein MutS